jgi:hypothetical protein
VRGSNHYLVKLERRGSTSALVFVRAGSVAEVLVPLGDYALKYATGNGELWCGPDAQYPFGAQTTFHRAEDIFTFSEDGNQYTGYTVELYLQANGNLPTSRLTAAQW